MGPRRIGKSIAPRERRGPESMHREGGLEFMECGGEAVHEIAGSGIGDEIGHLLGIGLEVVELGDHPSAVGILDVEVTIVAKELEIKNNGLFALKFN